MSERVMSIEITIRVDTNKDTYVGRFEHLGEAVAWWNDFSDELDLGKYVYHDPNERRREDT
jgi:hypothetical protein